MSTTEPPHAEINHNPAKVSPPVFNSLAPLAGEASVVATPTLGALVQRTQRAPRVLSGLEVLQLQGAVGNRAVSQLLAGAGPRPVPPAPAWVQPSRQPPGQPVNTHASLTHQPTEGGPTPKVPSPHRSESLTGSGNEAVQRVILVENLGVSGESKENHKDTIIAQIESYNGLIRQVIETWIKNQQPAEWNKLGEAKNILKNLKCKLEKKRTELEKNLKCELEKKRTELEKNLKRKLDKKLIKGEGKRQKKTSQTPIEFLQEDGNNDPTRSEDELIKLEEKKPKEEGQTPRQSWHNHWDEQDICDQIEDLKKLLDKVNEEWEKWLAARKQNTNLLGCITNNDYDEKHLKSFLKFDDKTIHFGMNSDKAGQTRKEGPFTGLGMRGFILEQGLGGAVAELAWPRGRYGGRKEDLVPDDFKKRLHKDEYNKWFSNHDLKDLEKFNHNTTAQLPQIKNYPQEEQPKRALELGIEFSVNSLNFAAEKNRPIAFHLDGFTREFIENARDNVKVEKVVTAQELRHVIKNWESFQKYTKFYTKLSEVPPPFTKEEMKE